MNGQQTTTVKDIDGRDVTVKVGDWVCFKCDIEQAGQIKDITGELLTLTNENGFHGHYIGGNVVTTERAGDCWVE